MGRLLGFADVWFSIDKQAIASPLAARAGPGALSAACLAAVSSSVFSIEISSMQDTNPLHTHIANLQERLASLRGYL